MVKRVSMKGKGADIFFGEVTGGAPVADAPIEPVAAEASSADQPGFVESPPYRDAAPTAASHHQGEPDAKVASSSEAIEPAVASSAHSPTPSGSAKQRPAAQRKRVSKAASPETGKHGSEIASTKASVLARDDAETIEAIRKTVKVPGKEVSFVRLTRKEKDQLEDLVYTYKRLGRRTTETEINRIAVNFMLEDYRSNGANSIVARVLEALFG